MKKQKGFIISGITVLTIIITAGLYLLFSFNVLTSSSAYHEMLTGNIKLDVSFFSRMNFPDNKRRLIENEKEIDDIAAYIGQQKGICLPFNPKGSLSNEEQILYSISVISNSNVPLGNITIFGNVIIFSPLIGNRETYFITSPHHWADYIKEE